AASSLARTYDGTRPTASLASAAGDPVRGAFGVTLTFSESVTGLTLGSIAVTNGSASNLAGSGTTYTFDVAPAGHGAGAAADGAGNASLAATTLTRAYDSTRPSVTLSTSAPSPTNAPFSVTATFSEPVTGLALGGIAVGNGSASNLAGSGASYTFDVTPA